MKGRNLATWLICAAVSACMNPAEGEAPRELIGVWRTQAQGYEDCELEIRAETITFSKGLTHADMNRICRVKSVTSGAVREYEIRYEDRQGQAYTLSLIFAESGRGGVIRFKNQRQIAWKRSKGNALPVP